MDLRDESNPGFDLSNCKVGDTFLGCPDCIFRWPVGAAANPICPECRGTNMRVYTVKAKDVVPFSLT